MAVIENNLVLEKNLRQGDLFSTNLFSLEMEVTVRDSQIHKIDAVYHHKE